VCVSVCLCTFIMSMCSDDSKTHRGAGDDAKTVWECSIPNGQFQCTLKTRQLGAKAPDILRLTIEAGNGTGNIY